MAQGQIVDVESDARDFSLPSARNEVDTDGLQLLVSPDLIAQESQGQPFVDPTTLLSGVSLEQDVFHIPDLVDLLPSDSSTLPQEIAHKNNGIPSPYYNYLQVQKHNFYAARVQNALYLGVPLRLAQKTESVISPWYWHREFARLFSHEAHSHVSDYNNSGHLNTNDSSGSNIFVRPVRRRPCFELSTTVMPDLAPTKLQQSHPHEMYIDLIPFPIFRDRVITLLSMTPPAFDESELQRDIESEGLLVWGVGQGTRDRTASLLMDRRSWECASWFAKWKLLINGSGLEEQSKWWRTMRGDDESDDEGLF